MQEKFYLYPVITVYADSHDEAVDAVLEAIFPNVGEIPGWLPEPADTQANDPLALLLEAARKTERGFAHHAACQIRRNGVYCSCYVQPLRDAIVAVQARALADAQEVN